MNSVGIDEQRICSSHIITNRRLTRTMLTSKIIDYEGNDNVIRPLITHRTIYLYMYLYLFEYIIIIRPR